jgi:hypothetical protein
LWPPTTKSSRAIAPIGCCVSARAGYLDSFNYARGNTALAFDLETLRGTHGLAPAGRMQLTCSSVSLSVASSSW